MTTQLQPWETYEWALEIVDALDHECDEDGDPDAFETACWHCSVIYLDAMSGNYRD